MALNKIPKKYIEIDEGYKTRYLQHKKTGRLVGRTGRDTDFGKLPKLVVARIDKSPAASMVRRVSAKKGIYASHSGEIFGRSIVRQHRRTSKKGKTHTVIKHRRRR